MEDNFSILENNKNRSFANIEIEQVKEQKSFLETTLGKTINTGLDIGLRILLPDLIENQVIEIKDTIFKEGFQEGIKKAISSAIDLGKSAVGIITGNFENISQVNAAVKNGGIIDGISNVIDFALNKTNKAGILPNTIIKTIKQGKNVILNNIANNIEEEFHKQLESVEKVQKYSSNWNVYYKQENFEGMQKEYKKLESELKKLVPLESTIKQARLIENLHMLVKNNGGKFNLSEEQLALANKLI
ncbi:MAG: hypothetical protein ACLS95_01420 [Clostridia bacterium]